MSPTEPIEVRLTADVDQFVVALVITIARGIEAEHGRDAGAAEKMMQALHLTDLHGRYDEATRRGTRSLCADLLEEVTVVARLERDITDVDGLVDDEELAGIARIADREPIGQRVLDAAREELEHLARQVYRGRQW